MWSTLQTSISNAELSLAFPIPYRASLGNDNPDTLELHFFFFSYTPSDRSNQDCLSGRSLHCSLCTCISPLLCSNPRVPANPSLPTTLSAPPGLQPESRVILRGSSPLFFAKNKVIYPSGHYFPHLLHILLTRSRFCFTLMEPCVLL